jgi:hypothetical protein
VSRHAPKYPLYPHVAPSGRLAFERPVYVGAEMAAAALVGEEPPRECRTVTSWRAVIAALSPWSGAYEAFWREFPGLSPVLLWQALTLAKAVRDIRALSRQDRPDYASILVSVQALESAARYGSLYTRRLARRALRRVARMGISSEGVRERVELDAPRGSRAKKRKPRKASRRRRAA